MNTTFYDNYRDVPVNALRWRNFSPAEITRRGTGRRVPVIGASVISI